MLGLENYAYSLKNQVSDEEQLGGKLDSDDKKKLLDACKRYPLRPWEHLMFEYVMLDGVNDSDADARRVAGLVGGLRCKINLIPYNSGRELPFRASKFERVLEFQKILMDRRVPTFIRISRGQDIRAACGQLSLAIG